MQYKKKKKQGEKDRKLNESEKSNVSKRAAHR